MNKNIRRSLVIAAGVSGAWALGSAVASADELPAHSLSVPDRPLGAAGDVSVAGTDVHAGTDTQHTVTRATQATQAVRTTRVVHGPEAAGGTAAGTVRHAADQAARGAAGQAGQTAQGAVDHVAGTAQDEIDYLFGPLSAFAPDLAVPADAAGHAQAPAPQQAPAEVPAQAPAQAQASAPHHTSTKAPTQVHTLGQALGEGSGHVLGQAPGGGQRTYAAAEQAPAGSAEQVTSQLPNVQDVPVLGVALQAVGDVLYIQQGIQADVLAGRLPDNIPADTARLVEHLVDGLTGASGASGAAGTADGAGQ